MDEAKAKGPMFHENVATVRVTRTGPSNPVKMVANQPGAAATGIFDLGPQNAQIAGKDFTKDGETFEVGKLGWSAADLAQAEADPGLVVERFDKAGRPVRRDGSRYPKVSERNTPQPPAVN